MKLINEYDKLLRQKATEVVDFNSDLEHLSKDMIKSMIANDGIGLAAPQLGLMQRIFVMKDNKQSFVCVNPKVIEVSDSFTAHKEGCLSFPGLYLKIKRPSAVKVEYHTLEGTCVTEAFDGILAACFQHELDHLNGIIFTTKVPATSLKIAQNKRRKK